jgi:T1SS-143 domain-containing protein
MSIEDPRLSSIDNTSAADEFDSAVEQHLGFASETVEGIEVAQAETPDAGRTDRLPAQQPVDVAAAVIPSEVTPDNENVVTLPAGVELDNLEFQVEGENLVLVLADGTEITVIGGAANIPTFVIGDVELPQVALFAALEESNINVAAGPDGTFSAQSTPAASRNFNDDPINAGPEDFALADLLGDTSFGDELRTAQIFGGNGRPSIPTPLTTSFIYDEAVIAGGDGVKIISGRLPFNPGPDSGTITAIGFVGASDVDEGDGLKVLAGFTSGGLPISVTSFAPVGPGLSFLAAEGRDSAGNLVFTITVTNRVTGDFTFELVGKLEHPDAGSNGSQDDLDDLLRLGFTYTVTDRDGDSVTGTFNIDVQDDAPTIGAPVGGSVNEDDLTGKVEEPKLVKRISDSESDSDMPLSNTSKAEGSLAIRWGADNDLKSETLNEDNQPTGDDPVGRTVSFTGLDTSSTSEEIQAAIPGLAGLSSDGFRLAYRIEYTTGADGKWNGGYQLVAFKAFDGPLKPLFIEGEGDAFLDFPYRGEGETIFIITLNPTTANGSYTFELIGNLDHYVAGGSGSVPSETDVSARVFGPETPREAVDFLDFEIPFTATDSDGDSADGKFTVRVEDDEPVIVGRPIAHTVDEDDISTIGRDIPGESLGTSPNDGNRDGSFTGDRGSNNPGPATVSGSFAGMVDFGADNRFTTYSIIDEDAARAALTRLGLTSKGGVLSFDLIGDTLYAFVNAGEPGVVYNAGPDRLVFTLTVEANGEYAFKLFDQLDHDLGKGQNTDLQDKIEGDVRDIDFGQIIKASDFDGDSVSLEGYFSVTIRDDVPELVRGASEDRTVDEDDISTIGDRFPGESLGTSPNDGNADGSFTGSQGNNQPGPAFIAGSLASLVKSGADESLTFSFINGDVARGMLESLGLSSKGAELSYEIRNGVLYAFDNAGSELGKSYDPQFGDRLVFELKLNGNGSYEFRLYDQLDHDAPGDDFWERPTNSDENFDLQDGLWFKDVTAINFGALIKATDYDGDSVSLNNAFSIKIRDDVPELSGKEENRLVDEDDIKNDQSTGNFPNDGSGDGSFTGNQNNNGNGPANISGSLAKLIKGGADDTVEFSFIREDAARAALEKLGLKSEGAELSYDIRDGVLYAFDNAGPQKGESYDPDNGDRLVFKLTLSKDGSYTFELLDQLDHDLGGGQNTDLQNGPRVNEVEAIDFGSIIKATDYDGDSVVLKDAFSITIKDDAPVLSGRKENRIVDEDDISTLNDGLIGGSLGTSPNDDDEDDDSFTGSPNNNQPGPAFISGSLANLVRGGADDPIKFSFIDEATVIRTLENLGLSSKGEELSYDIQGNVLYGFDNDKGSNSYGTGDRPVFKLTLSEDGSYTFELLDQLDHDKPASGVNENYDLQDDIAGDVTAINFGALIKATDYDGDSVSLDGAFSITIRDDVPTAFARNTNETLVVDESDKRQNDDVTGPLNVFKFVGTKGEDPNMSAQFAQQSNFVAADINGGADDDVKIEWDLKINGGNGTPSGLFTTDGRSIVLFLENGLIVGRYDSPNDGNTNITSSDPAAFALHLSDNGTLSMVQYVSIRHDDPSDHDENDDANDGNPSTALQTLAGKVNAVLTVTDYDGDKAVSEVAVGDRIQFQDDGPVANFSGTVIVTEDGTTAGSFLTQSATGTLSFDAGADGAKVTSIAYRFGSTILEMSEGNSDPQSFPALTSGGQPVVVTTSTDGLTVTGTVTVDGVAKPVFTLVVTNAQTGAYTFTQTAPIDHPDRNEAGQSDSLRMVFDFTVTDGDGDTSTNAVQVDIRDDGPVANFSGTVIVTEDGTTAGSFLTQSATGTLSFDAGADGAKVTSIAYRFGSTILEMSEGNSDPQSFPALTSGGQPVVVTTSTDGLTVTGTVTVDGVAKPVFTLVVTNAQTGAYTFTQTAPIDHPDRNEAGQSDSLRMVFDFTVTDGDGDTSTNAVQVDIRDDGPVANFSGTVIVTEDGTTAGSFLTQSATGTLSFDAGADGAKVTSIAYRFGSTILEMSEGNSDPQSFPALTSGGQPVVVTTSTDGLTVTGTVTVDGVAKPVFTLVVTNAQTGAYTFTQTAPIDHPDRNEAGQSDSLRMVFDFTVTDGDGDTSSSSIQIDILDDAPTLVSTPTTGLSLNEDDLIPGNDETAPKEPLSVTGNLNISLGADGGSIALSAPAAEWSATNKTLTATDGSWKVTLNSDGTYKFDLLNKTLAHGFGDNGQNTLSIDVTYTATDGDQDVLTGSFTIEIVDDVPVAVGESATVREAVPGVGGNLILAFDVSGSMSDPVNGGGSASRISVAKQAAINLINASDAAMIMIVTFAGNAQASQWLSKADALAFIQGNGFPSPAGGTEYDDAVEAIMDANAGANLTGTNTSLYFFSDGRVSDEDDLSNQELRAWENFLRDNDIDSYAVGVGSNVSENDSDLGQIAFPNNVDNVIVITSPTDPILLGTVTAPAVPTSASGNVLTNDSFGADGGRILSILVDGVTHTWDGTDANKVLSVTTALGGSLTFNFSTGDWEYDAPAQLSSNTPETFTYTLVDGDGDTTTANLVVNIQAVNDAPENVVPSSLTAAEDIELSITNVIVSDADAGNGDLTVKLEVKKGTLTLATEDDLVVSNNGSDTVTLTGSLTAINAALLGMKYKGDLNFNGSDELKITTTDNGNTGIGGAKTDVDTVAITVTPVNDAPTATDDVLSAVSEDSIVRTISFASLLGNDSRGPSNESTQSLTITELSNVVGGTAEIRGTNILFTPAANFNGVASFDYTVRDNGQTNGLNDFKTDVGSVSFSVTPVNDAPVNTVPSSLTAVEDTELAITGVSISDVDAGGSNMTVKLEVKDGTLTLASTQGVTAVSSSGGATLTLTGTVTAINTALAGLKYKGDLNFNGSDQLKITTTDNGNTGAGGPKSDVDTVNITVTPVPDTATVSGKQNVDMRSYDKVVYNNASHDPQGDTAAIVSNFDVANHKIAITVGSPAVSVTGGTFVTVSSLSDIYAAGSVIEILRETNSSANDGDNAAIEQLIYRSIDDIPQGFYTVIVYGSTRSNADAYVFTMKVNSTQSGGQTLDTDEFSIEHVMTLQSVGYGSLRASNFVAAADPIILDLDRNGFAFSSIDNGVTFDINADGKSDQIAWTSDDGILAYDVDGNGLIDNGSEIFTPDFNGGKFASGVAALASLDSNSDGKIDANDDAFSKLKIWVDANNNGISDEGELSSLFDNGVTSISLTTDNTGGQEDGQTVFSTGTFTFADGSTGDFMEVGFDTIFGSDADPLTVMGTDGDDILHGGMGQVVMTGGAGNDTFVFDGTALDELDVADVITDFNGDGDVLDVTALLDSLLGEQASAETAASHLRATVDDGNTTVSVQTGADTWKDVVVLQNHDTAIKVLFDDKHAVVTPHD